VTSLEIPSLAPDESKLCKLSPAGSLGIIKNAAANKGEFSLDFIF